MTQPTNITDAPRKPAAESTNALGRKALLIPHEREGIAAHGLGRFGPEPKGNK